MCNHRQVCRFCRCTLNLYVARITMRTLHAFFDVVPYESRSSGAEGERRGEERGGEERRGKERRGEERKRRGEERRGEERERREEGEEGVWVRRREREGSTCPTFALILVDFGPLDWKRLVTQSQQFLQFGPRYKSNRIGPFPLVPFGFSHHPILRYAQRNQRIDLPVGMFNSSTRWYHCVAMISGRSTTGVHWHPLVDNSVDMLRTSSVSNLSVVNAKSMMIADSFWCPSTCS